MWKSSRLLFKHRVRQTHLEGCANKHLQKKNNRGVEETATSTNRAPCVVTRWASAVLKENSGTSQHQSRHNKQASEGPVA